MKGYGKRLRELRGEKSISEVAAALNASPSSISMYESEERAPRDDIKEKLAKYYGTTVGALFFEENVTN